MKNNPAGVLLETMRAVKASPLNHTMTDVWARVLECDPSDTRKIVAGVQMFMNLSTDEKSSVHAYAPGGPEIYLTAFVNVDSFLNTHHLGSQLSQYVGYLDDSTMTALAFTDHILQLAFSREEPGATNDVRDFVVTLDALLEQCLSSALSQELKDLFVKNLEALRQALIKYRLGGEAALQSALDVVTGSIVRNQDSIKSEYEIAGEFVEKTAGFMGKVEDLIHRAQNIAVLATPVMNVLLPFFK